MTTTQRLTPLLPHFLNITWSPSKPQLTAERNRAAAGLYSTARPGSGTGSVIGRSVLLCAVWGPHTAGRRVGMDAGNCKWYRAVADRCSCWPARLDFYLTRKKLTLLCVNCGRHKHSYYEINEIFAMPRIENDFWSGWEGKFESSQKRGNCLKTSSPIFNIKHIYKLEFVFLSSSWLSFQLSS